MMTDSPVAIAPGTLFAGRYQIVSTLARGGMGTVHVAVDTRTNKKCGLKLMHSHFAADPAFKRRFETEAKVVARLESEHILDVRDFGFDEATASLYLAMELLNGDTLEGFLNKSGPPPAPLAAEILTQLFFGMATAHAASVVHRDLKPENVFLHRPNLADGKFVLKILDFGIAKDLNANASKTKSAMGTPLWMAPEQTQGGVAITPAADVWALALIAFAVLTGKAYWLIARSGDADAFTVLREVLFSEIEAPSRRLTALGSTRTLPAGFDRWFARAMMREPSARFPNATEAWVALAPLLLQEPVRLADSTGEVATSIEPGLSQAETAGGTLEAPELGARQRTVDLRRPLLRSVLVASLVPISVLGVVGALALHRGQGKAVQRSDLVDTPRAAAAATQGAPPVRDPPPPTGAPPEATPQPTVAAPSASASAPAVPVASSKTPPQRLRRNPDGKAPLPREAPAAATPRPQNPDGL